MTRLLPSTRLLERVHAVQREHVMRTEAEVEAALEAVTTAAPPRPNAATAGATVGWTSDPAVIARFCALARQYAKGTDGPGEEDKPLVHAPDPFQQVKDAAIGQRLFFIGDADGQFCAGMLVGAPWCSPVPVESLRLFDHLDSVAFDVLCSGRYHYCSTFVADASLGLKGMIPRVYQALRSQIDEDVALVAYTQIARERDLVDGRRARDSGNVAALVGHHRGGLMRAGWGSTFESTPGLVAARPGIGAVIPEAILFSLAICPAKSDRDRWPVEADLPPPHASAIAWQEALDHRWRSYDAERVWPVADAGRRPEDADPVRLREKMMADLWDKKPPFPVTFPHQLGDAIIPFACSQRVLDAQLGQLANQRAQLEDALETNDEQKIRRATRKLIGGAESFRALAESSGAPNILQARRTVVREKLGVVRRKERQVREARAFLDAERSGRVPDDFGKTWFE